MSDDDQSCFPLTQRLLAEDVWQSKIGAVGRRIFGHDVPRIPLIDFAVMVLRPDLALLVMDYHAGICPQIHEIDYFKNRPGRLEKLDRKMAADLERFRDKDIESIVQTLRLRLQKASTDDQTPEQEIRRRKPRRASVTRRPRVSRTGCPRHRVMAR